MDPDTVSKDFGELAKTAVSLGYASTIPGSAHKNGFLKVFTILRESEWSRPIPGFRQ